MKKQIFASAIVMAILFADMQAQTIQGPFSPQTFSSMPIAGALCNYANASNIQLSDNLRAASAQNLAINGNYTNYLVASNFGFNVPPAATINGIVVEIERMAGNYRARDYSVRIIKGGALGSLEKASTTAWPLADEIMVYGHSADGWGTTWTASDINNPNFGIALSAMRKGHGTQICYARVDHIRITVYYTLTLPIVLTAFNALSTTENMVALNWETESELDNNYFSVERSTNGGSYIEIGQIDGAGTSNYEHEYAFIDAHPIHGRINYYRLKQVDANNNFTYSSVQSVYVEGISTVSVFPNPAQSQFNIAVHGTDASSIRLYMYNIYGADVSNEFTYTTEESGISVQCSSATENKGIYLMQVYAGDQKLTTERIFIF